VLGAAQQGRGHRPCTIAIALAASASLAAAASAGAHPAVSPLGSAGRLDPPARMPGVARSLARAPRSADYRRASYVPASRSNYTVDDRPFTDPITRLVVHVAQGSLGATTAWFRNPHAQASAHYVVGSDGRVAQSVLERNIAWHAGNWDYNVSSIGIEHAGFTNRTFFPDVEYRASARLAGHLARKYLIPPDRAHVIGHSEVPDPFHDGQWGGADHHTDPGRTWDWTRYMAYLRLAAHDTAQMLADDGIAGTVQASGAWTRRRVPGAAGGTALGTASHRSDAARFVVRVPRSGAYDVFLRWPCDAGASSRVRVDVRGRSGVRSLRVSQRTSCARWVRLGRFTLARGPRRVVAVQSRSRRGGTIYADAVRAVAVEDAVRPRAPSAVAATPRETSASVRITGGSDDIGLGGFAVSSGGRRLAFSRARELDVPGLACGTAYTLAVRAIDLAGNRSGARTVSLTTTACPRPPSGLRVATRRPRRISASWTRSPTARVIGYSVWANGRRVAATSGTRTVLRRLSCSTAYTVTVRAYDAGGGRSSPIFRRTATLPCPGRPGRLRVVERGRRHVTVGWAAAPGTVAGYRLYIHRDAIARTGATSFTFRHLRCGRRYRVGVRAYDGVGDFSGISIARVRTSACR
jgi:N-acetyl-anhydromuramyl-L-alanine amidase AmpD